MKLINETYEVVFKGSGKSNIVENNDNKNGEGDDSRINVDDKEKECCVEVVVNIKLTIDCEEVSISQKERTKERKQ